jgi:hypothetical protein
VIGLQECFAFGSRRRDRVIQQAIASGFCAYVASSTKGNENVDKEKTDLTSFLRAGIDGGLLILSRYPIVKSARLTFDHGIGSDRYAF